MEQDTASAVGSPWPAGRELLSLPRDQRQSTSDLLRAEYDHLAASLLANEEAGERRVNVLVGLVAAVIAGLGLAADGLVNDPQLLGWAAVGASALLLGFGLITLRRIMERNLATTDFLNRLRLIRVGFLLRDPAAVGLLPFVPSPDPLTRSKGWGLGKAGFLETVALVNSVVAAVGVAVVAGVAARDTVPWEPVALAVGASTWVLQIVWSRRVYRNEAKKLGAQRQNALRWWIEELKGE